MDLEHDIYLARSYNELNLSMMVQRMSDDKKMQVDIFKMKEDTYYSAVIAHAYYSIFYAAKAYLLHKGIKTKSPEEHRKTFEAFAKFVESGKISVELLKIYKHSLVNAETLLHIFELEKGKRTRFTYKKIPQANQLPAQESIKNADFFLRQMRELCKEN